MKKFFLIICIAALFACEKNEVEPVYNHIVESYSKKLSEFICGTMVLLNQGAVSDEVATRLKNNANELASLALELEQLSKP